MVNLVQTFDFMYCDDTPENRKLLMLKVKLLFIMGKLVFKVEDYEKVKRVCKVRNLVRQRNGFESSSVKCVDQKYYKTITKGKTYEVFMDSKGENYKNKSFVQVRNNKGAIRAYRRDCFRAV